MGALFHVIHEGAEGAKDNEKSDDKDEEAEPDVVEDETCKGQPLALKPVARRFNLAHRDVAANGTWDRE